MSESTLKPALADRPWQRLCDSLPPRTVCGIAALVSLLLPVLLLRFPLDLAIGGVIGLLTLTVVLAWPYVGLLIFLALLYLRPEETFHQLAGARMTLIVSMTALFAWAINALLRRERFLLQLPVVRCFVGFTVLAIGSTALAVSDFSTLNDIALEAIKLLILFVLVIHLVNTESRLRFAMGTLLLLTAILGARTLWQFHNGEGFVSEGDTRAMSTGIFGDPNDLALAMAMALPIALGFALGKVRPWTRLWSLATVPILGWTIFVTNSRGGMLALAASLFLFFGRRLGRAGSIVGAVVVLVLFTFGPSRMSQMSADEESAQGRVTAWEAGMDMLQRSPIWGVGKDQFVENNKDNYLTAHNSLVLCLAELGLLGTAFWIGLFYFTLRDGRRAEKLLSLPAESTPPPGEDPLAQEGALPVPAAAPPVPAATASVPAVAARVQSLRTQPALLQISLVTFMVGGFFLSRTYTPPLYVYLGMAVAAAQVEADRAGQPLPPARGRDWFNIAALTGAGWALIQLLIRLWSR